MNSDKTMLKACALALCFLAVQRRPAEADATLRDLRFRAGEGSAAVASPAVFASPQSGIDILFEARGEPGSTVQVTVRGLGGVVLASQTVASGDADWQAKRVAFEGRAACTAVSEGLRSGWQGSRADAERLANARAGHQEFLLQVHARVVTLRSLQTLADGLAWGGTARDLRSELAADLVALETLVVRARALPASDLESLKLLAQDMVDQAEEAFPHAQALLSEPERTCPAGLPLPNAGGAAYDVTLSQGGFPALAGEFRIMSRPALFLPRLARP